MAQQNRRSTSNNVAASGHHQGKTFDFSSSTEPQLETRVAELLHYLQHGFSAYPFNPKLDTDFVLELAADFERLNLLEQLKTFRWYYDDDLSRIGNPRAALRRWMARAWDRFA